MGAEGTESVEQYVADFDCLIEGVVYFLQLQQKVVESSDIAAIRSHYEVHPEDGLCHIYRPGTRDMLLCRKSGIEAIERMALRLIAEAPNGFDLSSKDIRKIISERIFQVAMDQVTDDEELVRVLKSYVALSETEHLEAAYHFPCVLFHYRSIGSDFPPPPPDRFTLGPVMFARFPMFISELTLAIQTGAKQIKERALEVFTPNGDKYGWVASVKIPSCAPDVSRRRAEEVIETSINLLKVFIGLGYGKSMRLPHTAPARNRETCVLTEFEKNLTWTWHGASLEGALVAGDPLAGVDPCILVPASELLQEALNGNRDEVTNRLLDALRWFGDSSFEESGGVQIVKWIAALERLIATERLRQGITHNFCKRVALLASGFGNGNVEAAYRDARKAYDLRSDVMHGSRSQDDVHLLMNTGLVHDLTREAMLGALALHHALRTVIHNGRAQGMADLYDKAAFPHKHLFERLEKEFKPKR